MFVFHDQRRRLRAELVLRLRALEPQIGNETHLLRHLLAEYNGLLQLARQLADAILDDLEAAQDRGERHVDLAHYFWSRLDLVDLTVPAAPALTDAERLESLPGDV
jgi:hypothetical protein